MKFDDWIIRQEELLEIGQRELVQSAWNAAMQTAVNIVHPNFIGELDGHDDPVDLKRLELAMKLQEFLVEEKSISADNNPVS